MTNEQLIAIQFFIFCLWGLVTAVVKCLEVWESRKGFGGFLYLLGLLALPLWGVKFLIISCYIAKDVF